MLVDISIKNFAIIDAVTLSFEKGMTILTGETGAGKSIVIDAMNLLLGARASSDVVRKGATKAEVEGLFSCEKHLELMTLLEEKGIPASEEMIVRREVLANGRSVSRINGQLVNLSVLKEVGQFLVDIHGQHDQEELMRPSQHIRLLDHFGEEAFQELKKEYQTLFDRYKSLRKQVINKQKNEREHKARIEMLEFQIAELEAADLKAEEEQELSKERERLLNHKQIADTLASAYALLENEDLSSLANLRTAMNDLQSIEEYDNSYKELSEQLTEAYYVVEDVAKRLEGLVDSLDFNGERLMQIESRLDIIHSMTRKYGGSLTDVLLYLENITTEYQLLTGNHIGSTEMESQLRKLEGELIASASRLNLARHQLAEELEKEIHQELADLYMEKARFHVQFTKGKFNRLGNESVEFYISTNPGEDLKPLVKVASGGELSRLMLAIKSAFSRKEDRTSIVFDEVDTGVSGRVAQAIAQKIYKIGQAGQVLAISHLPQVIAIADYQYFIEKISDEASTVSQVRLLTFDERVEEIAKMLAGERVTDTARNQARELVKK